MTMNNRASLPAAMELDRISGELEEARADVTMLERLRSAVDRVKRLSIEQDKAIVAKDKALVAEAKAKEAEWFAGIGNVRVTQSDHTLGENVLRSSFTIEYTKPRWNMYETVQTQFSVEGFGPLPPEVLDYIIVKQPNLIPAAIMALAPDSPVEAFRQYFLGLRRGYLVG